jgi:hypothetical protein
MLLLDTVSRVCGEEFNRRLLSLQICKPLENMASMCIQSTPPIKAFYASGGIQPGNIEQQVRHILSNTIN